VRLSGEGVLVGPRRLLRRGVNANPCHDVGAHPHRSGSHSTTRSPLPRSSYWAQRTKVSAASSGGRLGACRSLHVAGAAESRRGAGTERRRWPRDAGELFGVWRRLVARCPARRVSTVSVMCGDRSRPPRPDEAARACDGAARRRCTVDRQRRRCQCVVAGGSLTTAVPWVNLRRSRFARVIRRPSRCDWSHPSAGRDWNRCQLRANSPSPFRASVPARAPR